MASCVRDISCLSLIISYRQSSNSGVDSRDKIPNDVSTAEDLTKSD